MESKDNPVFEISYNENKYADYGGTTKWTILQPYKTEVPGDAAEISALLENYSGLFFETNVDHNASDLGKYGLKEPYATISLNYYKEENTEKEAGANASNTETSSGESLEADNDSIKDKAKDDKTNYNLELLIGSADEEGDYYVKLKDSKAVHTMSKETVEKFLQLDAYNYTDHNVNMINLESVDHLDIVIDNKKNTMSIDKTKEKVDGEEIEVLKYTFNGNPVDETKFKELYQLIISPTTEHLIPKDYVKPQNDTPIITITYYRTTDTDKKVTVNYYPYDESYYRVNVNGVEYFLTDLRRINEIMEEIKKL